MNIVQYLAVASIFGWGIGSLFYKIATNNAHPIMVSAVVACVSLVLMPLAFIFVKFPKEINGTGILFAVLGALCMDIGTLAYFFALKRSEAGIITTITALYPALTLLLSIMFLHEGLNVKKGIGIALALISFIILNQK